MQAIDEIKKISPIAWQHVNFHGRYEFQKGFLNLDAIIQGLAEWAPPSGRPHQQLGYLCPTPKKVKSDATC
jgi:hypothetical protein